jgi:hypothetical protein
MDIGKSLDLCKNVEKQMSQNPTQLLRDDRPVGYMSSFALTPIPLPSLALRRSFVNVFPLGRVRK